MAVRIGKIVCGCFQWSETVNEHSIDSLTNRLPNEGLHKERFLVSELEEIIKYRNVEKSTVKV